ncbi:MAG: molybdenum cofactor biosynthesis protein MoaE [Flammeovirgaceae bacterium]|nr:molybdenum cofactor biosynthesis protein MoaE [Flammeovirgaceae bacterium]
MIKITQKPIDVQKVIEAATSLGAGAVNVFIGTVRSSDHGKNVRWLDYETTNESKAVSEIRNIIDMATQRWPVQGSAVCHRTGTLKPGEISTVIAVSCPNANEAFEATKYLSGVLEEKASIWKKEVFEDGEEWVSPERITA